MQKLACILQIAYFATDQHTMRVTPAFIGTACFQQKETNVKKMQNMYLHGQ
jgi:hypothetical protein